jgi:GntR family transcriptional regulator
VADELFLSPNDSRPMYLQIMDQIKQKIYTGDWPAGQALPSIRELSATTKVSVITVKRAYTELEEQGVIVTQAGRGSFVAESAAQDDSFRQQELQKQLESLLKSARLMAISDNDLIKALKKVIADNASS